MSGQSGLIRTRWIGRGLVILLLVGLLAGGTGVVTAADDGSEDVPDGAEEFKQQMRTVGNFLTIIIAAVAIPNGAFGLFQWMTAGTDTEQSDKGRKRIRNSFVGVAGAAVIMVAVRLLSTMVGAGI